MIQVAIRTKQPTIRRAALLRAAFSLLLATVLLSSTVLPEPAAAQIGGSGDILLGDYRTDYTITGDDSQERVDNLERAAAAIDGTVLAPGEEFSFDALTSTLEYEEARAIVDGEKVRIPGGGICQVSSTLYMAANFAGLAVTERHPHSSELSYIRPGLDATVWFDAQNPLDLKFVNSTAAPVTLRMYVADDGFVYAEVWGNQDEDTDVEMNSEVVSRSPEENVWRADRKVTDRDGTVLEDGVLHTDSYEPLSDDDGSPLPDVPMAPVIP